MLADRLGVAGAARLRAGPGRRPGRWCGRAEAFFGFLARIAGEAAAKRDLPDAISVTGSLREDLFAALDLLLRRAQQAGAVRAGIATSDLIVLLKGMFAGLTGEYRPGRARAGIRRAGRRAARTGLIAACALVRRAVEYA